MERGMDADVYLFKVLVVGEATVGKTAIIRRYVEGFFSAHYLKTIGVDFALKVVDWNDQTKIKLQLWDIAGQERCGNLTRAYYREAAGAFVVFDIMNSKSFEEVSAWKDDIDSKVFLNPRSPDQRPIPCILLANKSDLRDEMGEDPPYYCKEIMDDFCKNKKFLGWFETSAKTGANIDKAADSLLRRMLQDAAEQASDDGELIHLPSGRDHNRRGCGC
eukprot:Rmarinus@m.24351